MKGMLFIMKAQVHEIGDRINRIFHTMSCLNSLFATGSSSLTVSSEPQCPKPTQFPSRHPQLFTSMHTFPRAHGSFLPLQRLMTPARLSAFNQGSWAGVVYKRHIVNL